MKILVDAWNHFLANSSYYLEAIITLAMILFEIWCEDVTKTKYKKINIFIQKWINKP